MSEAPSPQPVRDVAPSLPERDFWFLDQRAANPAAYTVSQLLELSGPVTAEGLSWALDALAEREPVLRTSFHRQDTAGPVVPADDLVARRWTNLDRGCVTTTAAADWQALARRPARLDRPRGLTLVLHSLRPDRHQLLVSSHHLVLDGRGLEQAIDELLDELAQPRPKTAPAAESPIHGGRRARPDRVERDQAHWVQVLGGLPAREWHEDSAAPVGATPELTVDGDVVRDVAARAQSAGVGVFTVWAAGVGAALAELTGRTRIVTGLPLDTRRRHPAPLGSYTITVPLTVGPATTASELRDAVADAYDHLSVSPFAVARQLDADADLDFDGYDLVLNGLVLREDTAPDRAPVTVLSRTTLGTGLKAPVAVTIEIGMDRVRLTATHGGAVGADVVQRALQLAAERVGSRPLERTGPPPEPAREQTPVAPSRHHVPPYDVPANAGRLERDVLALITRTWTTVLERPVGVDDDFFALGGNSLRAARVVADLQAELGKVVRLRDLLFGTATPATVGAVVVARMRSSFSAGVGTSQSSAGPTGP